MQRYAHNEEKNENYSPQFQHGGIWIPKENISEWKSFGIDAHSSILLIISTGYKHWNFYPEETLANKAGKLKFLQMTSGSQEVSSAWG